MVLILFRVALLSANLYRTANKPAQRTDSGSLVMVIPLVLFLLIKYVPLFTAGVVPFVGPGGMLASFTMNLFHIIGVLMVVVPISTWFYLLSGRPYLGAFLNAAIVTWMFVSSQVIAPIPV